MKKVLVGLVVLVGILLAVIASRPSEFTVKRDIVVNAPPEVVFPWVSDFRKTDQWSPWNKRDLAIKKEFSEPSSGVGATYAWSGNSEVGKGNQKVVAVEPNKRVDQELNFTEPFAAENVAGYDLEPVPGGTKVTWRMGGKNNFMGKAFGLFMNMDEMIGKDFNEGLAMLKQLAEADARRLTDEAAAMANPTDDAAAMGDGGTGDAASLTLDAGTP